jgi:CRP/FNR family cyclic AMP-dependent transcriptional regulator
MSVLHNVAVFQNMAPSELAAIEANSRLFEPRDGARIFAQGDAADAVYAIVAGSGHVRIGALNRSSKGLMIAVCTAGDIFGEIGVIGGGTRTADAVVEGRVRLLRVTSGVFLDALGSNPALGLNLSRMLADRLRRTFAMFRDAAFESLEVRLARQLLYLASREGRRTERGIQLAGRFRQGDLADLLGATTRSIITILNAWRSDGLVIYDPASAQLTLCREAALQQMIRVDRG